jgi:hypothetical protein
MPLASRGEDGTQPPLHKRSWPQAAGTAPYPEIQQSSILGRCAWPPFGPALEDAWRLAAKCARDR